MRGYWPVSTAASISVYYPQRCSAATLVPTLPVMTATRALLLILPAAGRGDVVIIIAGESS